MVIFCLDHKRLPLIATLVLALCLLIAGMRVPDLSRPHRAKPSHRAVIENPTKTCQLTIKKTFEMVAVIPAIIELAAPQPHRPDVRTDMPARSLPAISPDSARAPPAFSA